MLAKLVAVFLILTRFLPLWMQGCSAAAINKNPFVAPKVRIKNGAVEGIYNPEYHQDRFLGIPFAQPPVGQLRFSRPKPLNSTWKRPYPAIRYGPFCHGNTLNLVGFDQESISYPQDEDCLTINVIRPSGCTNSSQLLPVLVWIHGGGFQEGGSGDARYDMSHLVRKSVDMGMPIIGVSINYRLGPFGFISGQHFRERSATNLGLHDQRLALGWVQENIAAFGGDRLQVTIQGESAGALSVGLHLLADHKSDRSLYQRAIAESGGPFFHVPFASNASQDLMLQSLTNVTGCSSHEDIHSCLQYISATDLRDASASLTWNPVIDYELVPDLPSVALEQGKFNRVPLLIGANTNEGTPFLPIFSTISARIVEDFSDALTKHTRGGLSLDAEARFRDLYLEANPIVQQSELGTVLSDPGEPYGKLYGPISLLIGDLTMVAGRRIAAESWANLKVDAYSYRFDTVPAGVSPQIMGAAHFQEIPFVFHNTKGEGYERNPFHISNPQKKMDYLALSELMSRMWISFVNTGSPNNHGGLS